MKKIPSFTIDHTRLFPGLYVSRRDVTPSGDVLTTFDVRLTRPNVEPALSAPALHAMEHLMATLLRNHPQWGQKTVYWGPMGCCTGSYLILQGDLTPEEIRLPLAEMMEQVAGWDAPIPGATARDCGNYTFMNLEEARRAARAYAALLRSSSLPTQYPPE